MPAATQAELARADELHREVNAYRQSRGGDPLRRHGDLDRLARQHSEFMRVNRGKFKGLFGPNLSHEGFEYRAGYALRQCGIGGLAENVAYCGFNGPGTVGALTKAWANSSSHQKKMSAEWAVTGLGIRIDDDGTVFATQLFGTTPLPRSQREYPNRITNRG